MKRLLLATDLSPRSELALARALRLARQHGAQLRVCHVVDDALPAHLAEAQKAAAETILQERIQTLGGDVAATVSLAIAAGRPEAVILQEATASGAELIMLGVHHGVAPTMFRGSTAERVIRQGRLPVLVVRREAEADYRQAVVGIDFSLHSLWAARAAFRVAPAATFHLVHSYMAPFPVFLAGDVRSEAREMHTRELDRMIDEELTAFLARLGDQLPPQQRLTVQGPATEVLLHVAGRLPADLLVIGTHGRTGIAHALLGSVAEDLLLQAHCDVLVAKAW
ncbi:universal stress protein [Geminicoccus roseus]|uniref:universal stress protein n=1 Tax=Geminicoccus roseus TaxID=404900 RepID=UPI0003FF2B30|nr:universal stress protein [Geminicoccus roseus]